MKRARLTALELAIASAVVGIAGLCLLIVPSHSSPPISAALALVTFALAGAAYRLSEDESGARTTAKAGAVLGVVVLADILIGAGSMW